MKKKKENLKGMSNDELNKKLIILREDLRVIGFKSEGSKSKNVKEGANIKKQIARIMTYLNEVKK